MPLSKNIIIIGGDLVGLELAEFLIERGRSVKVLEPSAALGPNLSIVRRSRVVHLLREHGAELLTQVNIKEITKDGVRYEHEEKDHIGTADQVIIAMGANPNLSLSNAIEAQGIPTSSIGDCTSVGYIHGAIAEARVAVLEL